MNRIELLDKLEEVVKTDGVIQCEYKKEVNGKTCYCTVGHIYRIVGLEQILNSFVSHELSSRYETLRDDQMIGDVEDFALSVKEIMMLQSRNDKPYDSYEDRIDGIVSLIKNLKHVKINK